jgi:hypothetical protein
MRCLDEVNGGDWSCIYSHQLLPSRSSGPHLVLSFILAFNIQRSMHSIIVSYVMLYEITSLDIVTRYSPCLVRLPSYFWLAEAHDGCQMAGL